MEIIHEYLIICYTQEFIYYLYAQAIFTLSILIFFVQKNKNISRHRIIPNLITNRFFVILLYFINLTLLYISKYLIFLIFH